MKRKGSNCFIDLLSALEVKHTKAFSNRYFNEHPHKYNLFGLSSMLTDYGVGNAGTKVEDKINTVQNIQTPFVAHIGSEFATVYSVTAENVDYKAGQHNISVTPEAFCDSWTGVVLLAEKSPSSIEPDYQRNKAEEQLQSFLKFFLLAGASLLLIFQLYRSLVVYDWGILFSSFLNLIGVFVAIMLVQRQMKVNSSYSDKICSLFKQADCNNILESSAAKLWNAFSWSEIGFSYFISNLIVIAFFPNLISYYAIVNICVLPYTLWSIWYQKFQAKQWCVLCLIVQTLLWGIFIVNLGYNYISLPELNLINIVTLFLVYSMIFVAITLFIPLLKQQSKTEDMMQEMNSIKSDEDVLATLLSKQQYFSVDKEVSRIVFGNPEADILVTILSNPHCNPCAKLHARIEDMLKAGTQHLCVQYIFSSFDESLEISNKFLIAAYLNSDKKDMLDIYKQWFTSSNQHRERLRSLFPFDLNNEQVERELESHNRWKSMTKLQTTPTILVNGHLLPQNYQIEDLKFITEL